jgi:hypothetical protein
LSNNFAYLPAQGTRGGALLAINEDYYKISNPMVGEFTVSAQLHATTSLAQWGLTVVYGPQGDNDKLRFLQKLRNVRVCFGDSSWLLEILT